MCRRAARDLVTPDGLCDVSGEVFWSRKKACLIMGSGENGVCKTFLMGKKYVRLTGVSDADSGTEFCEHEYGIP